jgi:2-hydroxychromene-2-carboxylate isomerase
VTKLPPPGPDVLPDRVEFFFDPMCPYAYQTSLWIREVRARRPLSIDWRFCSLEEINLEPGKLHPWEREWSYGWSQMRIGAYLRRQGMDAVDRWYAAVGEAFFGRAVPTQDRERHREVLVAAGFASDTIEDALADPTTHDEVRADHDEAVVTSGGFGVPTLVFPSGDAIFGPVVVPTPTGEAAERLWEHVVAWCEFPTLFEIKRPKTDAHMQDIAERFRPYLEARSWRTIQNPAR